MPIRADKKPLYPPPAAWKKLRASVLMRARNECECRGECGARHARARARDSVGACGVPNAILAARYVVDGEEAWHEHEHTGACCGERCDGSEPIGAKVVRIVLTIAHLDHDPQNNDLGNLRAFCQRCHLRYDAREHAKNARATREKKAGQGGLFG